MKKKYHHSEDEHNLTAPREIVPEILKLLEIKSVVDIGCGIGTFLHCFKENGIEEVLGIDGKWVNKNLLYKYISPQEFKEVDLEENFDLIKKYDLAISLEVAEHLSEKSADIFIRNLISAGKVILFAAAIPLQGGQNHINEQWLTYWEKKFLKYDYVIHDILRPIFWDNPNIFTWYKQNMVLVTPRNFKFDTEPIYNPLRNIVHYDLYMNKAKQCNDAIKGELSPLKYLGYLAISIIGRNNLKKIGRMLTKKN